jgi:alcohol dehydrogenase class IV
MNKELTRNITIYNPSKVVFGNKAFARFVDDFSKSDFQRLFVLTIPELTNQVKSKFENLAGISILINDEITIEPSFNDYQRILIQAREFMADSIVAIGGGSVLDTAKLIAATIDCNIDLQKIIADNSLLKRNIYLACLPTTAGTGSEVSPNAIFFNPENGGKTGVISPALVADAAYIDPELTVRVPPKVTAATGIDALTHCIEAYANRFAHPITDLLALEGIALIGQNLEKAFQNGNDLVAREKVALGSMYGGMCLGPVNTAAVHALAYPLGSKYKIAHGVSNALLLPHVMKFNLNEATEKYAKVACALGLSNDLQGETAALAGIEIIQNMISDFGIPKRLSDLNIQEDEIEEMAHSALKIQRLLKNNVREVLLQDAINIYTKAF